MSDPRKVRLLFNMSAGEMLLRATTMQAHYVDDQPAFAAASASFTVQFGIDFLTAVNEAQSAAQPWTGIADLKVETAEFVTAMENVKRQLQNLYFFVGEAWPNDRAKQERFGRKKIRGGGQEPAQTHLAGRGYARGSDGACH